MSYVRPFKAYNRMVTANGVRNQERMISIEQAWELVAMADRINNGRYVKVVEYAPHPDADPNHGPCQSDVILYRPNRDLIRDNIDVGMPVVTDEDRARGLDLAQHFQGLVIDALGGNQHEFDQKILKLIQKQEVGVRTDMALMACLGSRYRRDLGRERVAETVDKIGYSSVFQGVIDERIRRKITVLSKFAGRTFLGSVLRATDGENLYFWTSSKSVDHWPNDGEFEVMGQVKTHSTDQNGYQETRLTRVKIAT